MAKSKKDKKAKVHEDLDGLDVKVNALGEIVTNIDIDKIAKKVDKDADKVLAKATKEVKAKSKKPKSVAKAKAKVVKKK